MNDLKLRFALIAVACATATAGQLTASAQTNLQPEQPRIFLARTNELNAKVLGIDYVNREVVLQSTNGEMERFGVSDRLPNFDQVRPGDEVNIKYYESVAYSVVKPGEELSATSRTDAVLTRPPGKGPGGAAISTGNTTATIQSIDRDNRRVVLKTANGETVPVYVDPSVGNLKRIKEGDQVSVSMTQAIAVSVEKPGDSSSKTNSPSQ